MENGGVYLKKGEGRCMKAGGPWVYDNEVERIEGEPLDGDVVSVHDYNGFCLGKGFLNRRSKLRVRMLTRNRIRKSTRIFSECGWKTPGNTGKRWWTPAAAG